MGRTLVVVGLLITAVGVLMLLGVPLGRLPGDIHYRGQRGAFFFPVVTCLIVSVVLTIVLSLFRR